MLILHSGDVRGLHISTRPSLHDSISARSSRRSLLTNGTTAIVYTPSGSISMPPQGTPEALSEICQ